VDVPEMTHEMLEFVEALGSQGARSLIIGGYALAFLGVPRYTKVLELWVDTREAAQILRAIQEFFGGDDLGLGLEDLGTPGVVQLGYEPNRIDLVLLPDSDFEGAYARSQATRSRVWWYGWSRARILFVSSRPSVAVSIYAISKVCYEAAYRSHCPQVPL
jgi:hypothetical protein